MRFVVSAIAAAAFLMHVMLGCCTHHAHTAETPASRHETNAASCQCNHQHCHSDHERSPDQESPDDSNPLKRRCCESDCVFMTAAKTVIVKADFIAVWSPFAVIWVSSWQPSPSGIAGIDSGGTNPLPARIHLLHQVFLI